jgi:hypothetical protein
MAAVACDPTDATADAALLATEEGLLSSEQPVRPVRTVRVTATTTAVGAVPPLDLAMSPP